MFKKLYYGFEVHARKTCICIIDCKGTIIFCEEVKTTGSNFIKVLQKFNAQEKVVIVEESSMTYWVCQIVKDFADKIIPCDGKHNEWIYKDTKKKDTIDAYKLAELGRLDQLKEIYQPETDERAEFKELYLEYSRCVKDVVRIKNRIKDHLRKHGFVIDGSSIYNLNNKERYINMFESLHRQNILKTLYSKLETHLETRDRIEKELIAMGRMFPEVKLLQNITGVGSICSCGFVSIIQSPDRFTSKQSLWYYACLSIVSKSSAGKPLGYERLNRDGNPLLKDISYKIFRGIMNSKKSTGIRKVYEDSLKRTHNSTHSRLTTQRKILWIMLTLWKKGEEYKDI